MTTDRLRQLLDSVLADEHGSLDRMADGAYSSPYHFSRLLRRGTGESPVALRRRVMLERAAWQLRHGRSVTDVAWVAGYASVEGFSRAFTRAFGCPPSEPADRHWLPAPNGLHFHPPMSLWVASEEHAMNPLTEQLVRHDLDDTAHLLDLATGLTTDELTRARMPGHQVLAFEGPAESIADLLAQQVVTKQVWLAAIHGEEMPPEIGRDLSDVRRRHEETGPRWLATVRDIEARGGWDDVLVDALCDPPESFVMSSVVAHVLSYAAHRRQLLRHLLRQAGVAVDEGDPITWLRGHYAEEHR